MMCRMKSTPVPCHKWNPNDPPASIPDWLMGPLGRNPEWLDAETGRLTMETGDGIGTAYPGDYILLGERGTYPISAATFERRYELIAVAVDSNGCWAPVEASP